jgi:hypothetical protein
VRISPVPRNAGTGWSSFENAGAQALAAHLHQPKDEMRPTWMRARSFFSASFIAFSTFADVAVRFHVDEVDDDEPGHVAEPKLARDLVRRLDVGRVGGLLDIVLAGRAARS